MRPHFLLLLSPLALVACTAAEPVPETSASTAAIGQQVACIDTTRVAGRRAENNRSLVFELTGGQTFRNDLEEACPGIERAASFGSLSVDPVDARMCRGDMVRVYDPSDIPAGDIKNVPRCRLGNYTRIADTMH
ncbi:MAG TPA: hypothetical protein VF727_06605 [Allosphingosinicella sp.]|jgi:hypothetical protein